MTRRDRVPRLRSTAGTFALGALALLSAACASVPDLILDPGDASAEGGDASRSSDGSGMEATAQSDACAVACVGNACPLRCGECKTAACAMGLYCCANKLTGALLCKLRCPQ